jgi:SAM-dependent methyltransferase
VTTNLWSDRDHALAYLRGRASIPHRVDALEVLCELLPARVERVLDLGTGDGDTLALVRAAHPDAHGVGLDFGDEMLRRATERFAGDDRVVIDHHDLDRPLPAGLGSFDAVVSSFAIHHCSSERQPELYAEIFGLVRAGGVFVNAEHVASPTESLHHEFLAALGIRLDDDDPSNHLVAVDNHLAWLRDVGFQDVDCFWKWRELAVLAGRKPAAE